MRVLVACEYSGRVREAFRARGHDAWSCDLLPAEDGSPFHIHGDVLKTLSHGWDLLIAHPPCTYLTNSGVRWLHYADSATEPLKGRPRWDAMYGGAYFYIALRDAPIPKRCIENPIMHKYARNFINGNSKVIPHCQVVQPWWFGEPFFKATGFELAGLPDLVATNKLTPPKAGTPEHKAWSAVHRASPGPDRWKDRSRTYPGIAAAMAAQWG